MRFFLSLCCYAAVSGVFAPQAGVAQQLPPIFGFANKDRIPEVNKSGSPVFDKLRNEAMKKKQPLVIYLTGSSWCSQCNIFTREYIKKTNFKNAAGKKFIFWLVDTKQVPGNSPGTFQFKMVPEEAEPGVTLRYSAVLSGRITQTDDTSRVCTTLCCGTSTRGSFAPILASTRANCPVLSR